MADIETSIKDCCKQLKLSSNLAAQAFTQEGGTPQEYLLNLLTNEIEYRRERRKNKYLNSAGFPRRYVADDFRTDEIDFPDNVNFRSAAESGYNFDKQLKALLYPQGMFIETALKNYVLEALLDNAKSESFYDIYNQLLTNYKQIPNKKEYKEALRKRLALRDQMYKGDLTT